MLHYVTDHRKAIIDQLKFIDYGHQLNLFLNGQSSRFFAAHKDFIDNLDDAPLGFLGDLVNVLAVLNESVALHAVSESLGVISTIVGGIEAYRFGVEVLDSKEIRYLFNEYTLSRHNGSSATAAWQSIYDPADQVYGPIWDLIISLNNINPSNADQILSTIFEDAYNAYRLVGYNESYSTRTAEGNGIVHLIMAHAQFSVNQQSGKVPLTINFDATSSKASRNAVIQSYAWNFGDGQSGTGITTSHVYNSPGTYTITLTITDSDNYTDSYTIEIQANSPVHARFSSDKSRGPSPIVITDLIPVQLQRDKREPKAPVH